MTESLPARLLSYRGPEDDPELGSAEWSSAVSVLIRTSDGDPRLLFIRRARNPRDPWSGHMALPGGRREASDGSLLDTAIRETREEVGLELTAGARLMGRLDVVTPLSPRLPRLMVVPFVFALPPEMEPALGSPEVAELIWAPLEDLRDPSREAVFRYVRRSGSTDFPAYRVSGGTVWGLTHRIVSGLLARLD
ncbi:MAG: CoA pyrophosphatase [Gemmatimonadota bacterium]